MTKVKTTIAYIILIIASFLSAFPLYYMICGATNSSIDIVRGKLFPGIYLMENYQSLIANQNLGRAMFNSFRNAIVITVIALLICSIAGYGFEIYHDKGKDLLMNILLLAMMLPFVAIMIPLFKMFSSCSGRQPVLSLMILSRQPVWKDLVRSGFFLPCSCQL